MIIDPLNYGLHGGTKEKCEFIHMPPVYRYMETEYVDEFFNTGRLRIPSMRSFAKHPDDVFSDPTEGNVFVFAIGHDLTVPFITLAGRDCYVLCGSQVLSRELADNFGRKSAIQIINHIEFSKAVYEKIPKSVSQYQGPAIYADSYLMLDMDQSQYDTLMEFIGRNPDYINYDIQNIEKYPGNEESLKLTAEIFRTPQFLFRKSIRFREQHEYRYIWSVEGEAQDHIFVEAPEAIPFCRRVSYEDSFLFTPKARPRNADGQF